MIITVNDILYSDYFLDELDEAKNHYDLRGAIANEMGVYLANQFDTHVFQTIVQAAQVATAQVTGETDMVGAIIENADITGTAMETNPDDLIEAVFLAGQKMDEKNVPEDDRWLAVKPDMYNKLANNSNVQHGDFGNAGNGSSAEGKVFQVAGFSIVKSNNVPTTNIATSTVAAGTSDRQIVDARNTVGLCWHPSAAGTVKLLDLKTSLTPDPRRLGELLVARYAVGHGLLRAEAAVQLRSATPA